MRASLAFSDLSFTWPDGDVVLSDITADLGPGRIGLVGSNGSGKSTLLRLIVGSLTPTGGSISATGRIEFLPQDPLTSGDLTVADALAISPVLSAIEAVESGDTEPDLFDLIGNDWDIAARAEATLGRLGLAIDLKRSLLDISGGELTMLALAARLLRRPDILLLDEPTNHLDRQARVRIIAEVERFSGLVIIASHDRELLHHVDRIAEVRDSSIRWFTGTFTDYQRTIDEEQRAAEREVRDMQADLRKQRRELADTQIKLARRQRFGKKMEQNKRVPGIIAGQRKRSAQESAGRLRGEHELHVAEARSAVERAESKVRDDHTIRLDVPATAVRPGQVVLTMSDVVLPHVGRTVDLTVQGPERVAIVGPNGSGKTTLLKAALGLIQPTSGLVDLRVPARYLPQNLSVLDPNLSVIDNLAAAAPSMDVTERHAALARLLFRGRAAEQRVATLSGGELLRASLASIVYAEPAPKLLVLDEPTNHLDLPSQRHLVEALESFEGSVLVVSHDQRFLDDQQIDRYLDLTQFDLTQFDQTQFGQT